MFHDRVGRLLLVTHAVTPHDVRFLQALLCPLRGVVEQAVIQPLTAGHAAPQLPGLAPAAALPLPPLLGPAYGHAFDPLRQPTGAELHNAAEALGRIATDWRPDVVLAGPLHTAAHLAAAAGLTPLVAVSWGSDVLCCSELGAAARPRIRGALQHAGAVIADCRAVAGALAALAPRPVAPAVFPWGVDLALCRPDARPIDLCAGLGWGGCQIILHTRALEPHYDPLLVVAAFAAMASERPDARLVLLGEGSLRPQVQQALVAHGLRDRAVILPPVAPALLPGYFAEADVYISASRSDGASISLLEALACGVVPVVPDVGGNPEFVRPGANGRLFAPGDAASAAAALRAALTDAKCDAIRSAAVATARAAADWTIHAATLRQLVREVAAGAPRATAAALPQETRHA